MAMAAIRLDWQDRNRIVKLVAARLGQAYGMPYILTGISRNAFIAYILRVLSYHGMWEVQMANHVTERVVR